MHGTDKTSPTTSWESKTLSPLEWGGKCLLDSYRLVRRIQSSCELTDGICRRQRKIIEEQREFLKRLRPAFLPEPCDGAAAPAGDETERRFDGGARAVE